jgi:hypothetical protein
MSDDKKSESTGTNTRWWESYLVRYFSGAIVGAICLAVILLYAYWRLYGGVHTKLPEPSKDFPLAFVTLALMACGLVYSYIISAPITVIHFGRSGRSPIEQHVRYFWFGWVLSLGVVQLSGATGDRLFQSSAWGGWMLILLVCVVYLIVSHHINKTPRARMVGSTKSRRLKRSQDSRRNALRSVAWAGLLLVFLVTAGCVLGIQKRPMAMSLLAFALPTLFVGVMQYVTLWRILHSERAVHRFYRRLSKARNMANSKDIRETYTHLREHSNATFIVLLELCFSAFLILLIELYAAESRYVPPIGSDLEIWRIVSLTLSLIAFWMTPNLFMWSRANQIELDFASRPTLYSSNPTAATGCKP